MNEVFELTDAELGRMGIQVQINELKDELTTYDYIGTKIAMGVATKEDYAEEIAYTQQLRARIRELEEML